MCLRWRRHDDGRRSQGDIYDVNVHRLPLNDQKLHFYRIHIHTISMSCTSWDLAVGPCALVPQCREADQTLHTDCPHHSLERGNQSSQVRTHTIRSVSHFRHFLQMHAVKSMSLHSSLLAFSGLACACFVTDLAFTSTSNELMNLLLAMRREVSNSRPRTTEFISYCDVYESDTPWSWWCKEKHDASFAELRIT